MKPLIFDVASAQGLCGRLAQLLNAEQGELERRQFPDGETYLRFTTSVEDRDVILLCTLDRPDPKLAPLLFAASAARTQKVRSVGLVAPYLAYMRQDAQFHAGEAVTSETFARTLSDAFNWLVTVDPHLHRHADLGDIYSIPAFAATATDAIAHWIGKSVADPIIIGPDEESRQWVERIAAGARARSVVLRKERSGDYSVSIDASGLEHLARGTPVLVDDIASSARTLIEAVRLLNRHGSASPVCAVVHAIFADDAYQRLLASPVGRVVSTNSVAHDTNAIEIAEPVAAAVGRALERLHAAG